MKILYTEEETEAMIVFINTIKKHFPKQKELVNVRDVLIKNKIPGMKYKENEGLTISINSKYIVVVYDVLAVHMDRIVPLVKSMILLMESLSSLFNDIGKEMIEKTKGIKVLGK